MNFALALRLVFVGVVLLAGCSAIGPEVGSPSNTERSPEPTSMPTTSTIVEVTGDRLPADAGHVFAQVETILGAGDSPNKIVVTVSERSMSTPERPGEPSNSFLAHLTDASRKSETAVGGSATTSSVTLWYRNGTAHGQIEQVLAHEFVHVLQPDNLKEQLESKIGTEYVRTTDGQLVQRGIVEGAAVYATDEYTDLYLPNEKTNTERLEDLWRTHPTGSKLAQSPYLFGARYIRSQVDSPNELEDVYARPPKTTEQILHNLTPTEEPPQNLHVRTRSRDTDWIHLSADTKGELYTRVLLEDQLSQKTAARAAAGWGNDSLISYDNGTTTAYVWVTQWDTERDADEFEAAITEQVSDSDGNADVRIDRTDSKLVVVVVGPQKFQPTIVSNRNIVDVFA